MIKAAQEIKEFEAKKKQEARLLTVFEMAQDLSMLIILRCKSNIAPADKRRALRAFMVRARVRAGDALRYVIVKEYTEEEQGPAAYYMFCNLDGATCVDICKRWRIGPYNIRRIDIKEQETLPPFMFDSKRTQAGRFLYNASHNIYSFSRSPAGIAN